MIWGDLSILTTKMGRVDKLSGQDSRPESQAEQDFHPGYFMY